MKLSKEKYLDLYRQLTFCRNYEIVNKNAVLEGKCPGMCHPALGQEGFFVGIQAAMGEDDWLSPQWRGNSQFCLRIGAKDFTVEMLGRKNGPSGGLAGSDHIYSKEHKVGLMSGYLGQGVALAVGVALAYKLQHKPGCVVCGIGDGEMNEGAISEVLNMAAIYKLPIVFYVHNNGYAFSSPAKKFNAIENMADRANGFGIPSKTISGTNVLEIIDVMTDAIEKAHNFQPSLIEFITTRWQGHFIGDDDHYRNVNEVNEEKLKTDPVNFFKEYLISNQIAEESELIDIDKEQLKLVEEAFEYGLNSPRKTKEDCLNYDIVYAKN